MSRFRFRIQRPSASMVVASFALLLALSGPASAARRLLTGDDIQDDSLTGADVQEGSLAKVGDADRLDGTDSSGFLEVAAKAADSDLLDGLNSTDFLGASSKAQDADKLDGKDSSDFLSSGKIKVFSFTFDPPEVPGHQCITHPFTHETLAAHVGDPAFVSSGLGAGLAVSAPPVTGNGVMWGGIPTDYSGSSGYSLVGPAIQFEVCNLYSQPIDFWSGTLRFMVVD